MLRFPHALKASALSTLLDTARTITISFLGGGPYSLRPFGSDLELPRAQQRSGQRESAKHQRGHRRLIAADVRIDRTTHQRCEPNASDGGEHGRDVGRRRGE